VGNPKSVSGALRPMVYWGIVTQQRPVLHV
jgi:hypothetical protein